MPFFSFKLGHLKLKISWFSVILKNLPSNFVWACRAWRALQSTYLLFLISSNDHQENRLFLLWQTLSTWYKLNKSTQDKSDKTERTRKDSQAEQATREDEPPVWHSLRRRPQTNLSMPTIIGRPLFPIQISIYIFWV